MSVKARNPIGIYHGLSCDVEPCRRPLAEEETLILRLYDLADDCRAVFAVHGRECDCDFCQDVRGLEFQVLLFQGMLTSEVILSEALFERC